jgi:aspartate carbamoyltransferase catalytic subunit
MWHGRSLLGTLGAEARGARAVLDAAHADSWGGDELRGKTVANLFFEDSTRTRVSFTIAAQTLGAGVVDLSSKGSSVSKGESLLDTAWTIEAMGVDAIVVRSELSGAAALIDAHTSCAVINAGDGTHEHPTQALTDALNIGKGHGRTDGWDFSGLRVVIVGDVVSSRVARSNVGLLTALGAEVVLVGPATMAPDSMGRALGCAVSRDLDGAIEGADAVMMLRIQFERGGGALLASVREYHALYGMTAARAAGLKDGAVVLHPGPMNRGVEIAGSVADGARSLVLDLVRGGVAVRRAVLAHALGA